MASVPFTICDATSLPAFACVFFSETEKIKLNISAKLKEVMMSVDLDEATSRSVSAHRHDDCWHCYQTI